MQPLFFYKLLFLQNMLLFTLRSNSNEFCRCFACRIGKIPQPLRYLTEFSVQKIPTVNCNQNMPFFSNMLRRGLFSSITPPRCSAILPGVFSLQENSTKFPAVSYKNKECALAHSRACGGRLRHLHCTSQCASPRSVFYFTGKQFPGK